MFDGVFERCGQSLLTVIHDALDACDELRNRWVCTEHLLFVLTRDLDQKEDAAREALASMNINAKNAEREVLLRLKDKSESEPLYSARPDEVSDFQDRVMHISSAIRATEKPAFSQTVMHALAKAEEYSIFFGEEEIEPEHLLLAILDLKEAGAIKIFEELSVNLTFLRRQIMHIIAKQAARSSGLPNFRTVMRQGMEELLGKYQNCMNALNDLAERSGGRLLFNLSRPQLVHMVSLSYLGHFLATQAAFQRYLLEETLHALGDQIGSMDKELTATIVSSGAQSLRAEVRSLIENLWCNESRMLNPMLNDAEHDLIGSVIEDLWWAQSEEIALHDLFAEALDDHRRKHLMNLQKRRIEIAQRLGKLQNRLDETIKQCFVKHPISA